MSEKNDVNESAESAANSMSDAEREAQLDAAANSADLSAAVSEAIQQAIENAKIAAAEAQPSSANIMDSTSVDPTDKDGNPVPVTIPIALAPNIAAVYTTRLGGVSEDEFAHFNLGGKGGDDEAHVYANRAALAKELHAKLSLISQVHSGDAIDVDGVFHENADYGFDASGFSHTHESSDAASDTLVDSVESTVGDIQVIEADAQVSSQTNLALGVFAADCLPVLLADPVSGVIGAAHCGRKGLMNGVIASAVDAMEAKGADRSRIVATLGPCICGDCYEVGQDIADEFDAKFPGTFTLTRFGGPGIDLAKAARMSLLTAGVKEEHMISSQPRVNAATQYLAEDAELAQICREDNEGDPDLHERYTNIKRSMCTLENPLWFSHRRAVLAHKKSEGRMLALIVRY